VIVIKHSYISARDRQSRKGGRPSKTAAVGRAIAHLKYIQHRPGEDRGDGGREFFGESDDELSVRRLRKAVRDMRDSKVVVHKLTLAPEINPADKKAFTREVMQKIAEEKGQDLDWMAVEHNNTDHHHIHIVVLGKDKNGKDVRIDKKDYDKLKDYGDKFLERMHPLEFERARVEREKKERDRIEARKREREAKRQERIGEGLELPWLHQKIVREQLEPYTKWKEKQEEKERAGVSKDKTRDREPEKPYFQDTIEAAGKDWSKQNTLSELRELNQYLWDNHDERIDKPEYRKLVAWIKEKERQNERDPDQKAEKGHEPEQPLTPEKQKDYFEYEGKKYSKGSPYEKLSGLAKRLRDKDAERLPIDDYQRLRTWVEHADRARWSGVLEKQLELTHKKFERSKTMEDLKSAEGGRVIEPEMSAIMGNPFVKLVMFEGQLAAEILKSIPLDDRNRDYLKEGREGLESAKRDKLQEHNQPGRSEERKEKDRETIEKIDEALDQNQTARDKAKEKKKRKQEERDKEEPWDRYDPWGQY
jgi:type IV secretory pathway VirD2 relaxase